VRGLAGIAAPGDAQVIGTGQHPRTPEIGLSECSDALFSIETGTAANPSRLWKLLRDNGLRRGAVFVSKRALGVGS
jgi:hypothetical protein